MMNRSPDLTLDFNNVMAERLGPDGIEVSEIESLKPVIEEVFKGHRDLRKLGQLPYRDLPHQEGFLENLILRGGEIRSRFKNLLLLGTGGSALGAAFLLDALGDSTREVHLCDDLHPVAWKKLSALDPEKTFMVVVSKSGKTTETLAAFLYFRSWFIDRFGEKGYRERVLFVTDPKEGPLRRIADKEKIETLRVPPGVGGRYSVLSNVGLLPAAFCGIDIRQIMAGARQMDERCQKEDVWFNPAMMSAVIHFLTGTRRGRRIRVIMPYEDRLASYTEWFAQLWAESLGKRFTLKGEEVRAGSTPMKARGSVDQHSQLQLYLEGPKDKVVTLLAAKKPFLDFKIPKGYEEHPELSSLGGRSLFELLTIQRLATEAALTEARCPNLTIEMKEINPHTIGQLLYMAEVETGFAGALYHINPFDQPGVEMIKRYIKGLLGSREMGIYRKRIEDRKKDPRFLI